MAIPADLSFLYNWHSPGAMKAATNSLADTLGTAALMQAGYLYREAFVASRFAAHRSAEAVRLLPPRQGPTPDFAILLEGVESWYETTEADRPGRTRGSEYKRAQPQQRVEQIPDDHWVEPEVYLAVVRQRAAAKAAKAYDNCDGLIIWSNAFPIAQEERLDLDWWRQATEPARTAFPEVWYHFKNRFNRIY
jgi:hypothetical protein